MTKETTTPISSPGRAKNPAHLQNRRNRFQGQEGGVRGAPLRARGGPGLSVEGVAAELAVEEFEVAEGVEVAKAEPATRPSSSASQVGEPCPEASDRGEAAGVAPPEPSAHVVPSAASTWRVRGGGVHGSGSNHEAAPLSARIAPAARRTGAMAPVAKGETRGEPDIDPGCRNLTQSPPLEFGPETA